MLKPKPIKYSEKWAQATGISTPTMSSDSSAGLVTKFSEVSGAGRVVYFVQQKSRVMPLGRDYQIKCVCVSHP